MLCQWKWSEKGIDSILCTKVLWHCLTIIIIEFELFVMCLGAEDFTPEQDVEEVRQIEKQIKRRFAIGTQVRTKFCTSLKISYHDRSER